MKSKPTETQRKGKAAQQRRATEKAGAVILDRCPAPVRSHR